MSCGNVQNTKFNHDIYIYCHKLTLTSRTLTFFQDSITLNHDYLLNCHADCVDWQILIIKYVLQLKSDDEEMGEKEEKDEKESSSGNVLA